MSAQTKAARLLTEGLISPDLLPAAVYRVNGEHGRYTTIVGAHVRVCTCAHGRLVQAGKLAGDCSHILAAVTLSNATPEQQAGYQHALDARQARDAAHAERIFARLEATA